MQLSARNQLKATVDTVTHGEVMSTVRVTLPDGQHITAAITKDAVRDHRSDVRGVRTWSAHLSPRASNTRMVGYLSAMTGLQLASTRPHRHPPQWRPGHEQLEHGAEI